MREVKSVVSGKFQYQFDCFDEMWTELISSHDHGVDIPSADDVYVLIEQGKIFCYENVAKGFVLEMLLEDGFYVMRARRLR